MTQSPKFILRAASAAAALVLHTGLAQASCGSASCTLLNDRFALGTWDQPGWSVDLRLEALTQNQLREGTRKISPAELPEGEEAIERHTRNRSLITRLDYAVDRSWSFSLRVPLLHRDHLHDLLDEETGDPGARERWRFTRMGDVQALMRWQAPAATAVATDAAPDAPTTGASLTEDTAWALTAGLKLPTGSRRIANADGSVAERALQPGTGTTDLVLGASSRTLLSLADALNLQFTWTQALAAKDGFKPGRRVELSAGWAHAMTPDWSLLLQANLARRERDSGPEAEPELSGSTTLSLSPGASVALGARDTLYGLVQVPVYQKVNGVQLMPRASLALGWTHSF